MPIQKQTENESLAFMLRPISPDHKQVSLDEIVDQSSRGFRDMSDFDLESIKPLAEDIAAIGLTTDLVVRARKDGKFDLVAGYRRKAALEYLASKRVVGFDATMRVSAVVLPANASELDMIAWTASTNVHRKDFSAMGRIRLAKAFADHRLPSAKIAQCLAVSEATIVRDLLVANNERLLAHVENHHISATDAAPLAKAAQDAGRMDELMETFEDWLAETQAAIESETDRRKASDEKPLSASQRWPQKHLPRDLVQGWREALVTGDDLGQPSFRFKASVREHRGRTLLEIDALKRDVSEMTAADLAKVYQRAIDLADELQPLVVDKAHREAVGIDPSKEIRASRGANSLRSLGLGHLVDGGEDVEYVDPEDYPPTAADPTEPHVTAAQFPSRPFVEGHIDDDE